MQRSDGLLSAAAIRMKDVESARAPSPNSVLAYDAPRRDRKGRPQGEAEPNEYGQQ